MPKIISTIVDSCWLILLGLWLYAKNNFYYCRYSVLSLQLSAGYMPKIISTIVDAKI